MTAKENKAVRALLKHCKAKNYPKWELDGILIDENKLIATNTKQLVVLDFMDSFQKEQSVGGTMAFESMPTSENIKVEFPTDLTFTLMANNSFLFENGFKVCIPYYEYNTKKNYSNYPDYQRLISPFDNKNSEEFKTEIISEPDPDYMFCRCVKLTQSNFAIDCLYKFLKILSSLDCEQITIKQKKQNIGKFGGDLSVPLHLSTKIKLQSDETIGVTYLIMPFTD